MRKALTTLILLVLSPLVIAAEPAQEEALESDKYTLVCNAAMESTEAAKAEAISMDIGRRELSRIRCNDMTVMDFAQLHSKDAQNWSIATVQ